VTVKLDGNEKEKEEEKENERHRWGERRRRTYIRANVVEPPPTNVCLFS